MKPYHNILICVFFLFCLPTYAGQVLFNKLPPNVAADYLDWTPVPVTIENLCGGYYQEPRIVHKYPIAPDLKTTKVTVTANKQVFYSQHGDSVLTGNVIMTQPGRLVEADKVVLHRNPKTGKISSANLNGHVRLREYGKLIIGDSGYVDFENNFVNIDNGIYWLHSPTTVAEIDLTGGMQHANDNNKTKILTLKNATYNTCRPDKNIWNIWSSTFELNRNTNRASAYNATFFAKDIPLFYFPYLNFSTDNSRKTGFLYPDVGYSNKSGLEVTAPFYLNLAPNYDATITPDFYSSRGLLTKGQFRFLTSTSNGEINGSFIDSDQAFKKFQKDTLNEYPNSKDPAVKRLKHDSDNRGYINFTDTTTFNSYWSAGTDINYVSDDYFINDFTSTTSNQNDDQLLNQVNVKYASNHWRFLAKALGFQTLHMVNDAGTQEQYSRLPQLDLTGNYPDQWLGMDYKINSEFVDFTYWPDANSVFISPSNLVTGERFNVEPSISLPITLGGAYIHPQIQLPATFYALHNHSSDNPAYVDRILPIFPAYVDRVLPIFDVDTGLSLARTIKFFGASYTQTLEPRVLYLDVPKEDQSDIPIFDSSLPTFNFDNLFRTNRFSSIDRIGDANQVALGLTSRFMGADDGQQKMKLGLGEIVAFQKHQLCMDDTCNSPQDYSADPLLQHNASPLVGLLQYNLSQHWNISSDAAWDFYKKDINNSHVGFQYLSDNNHIFNVGYDFAANGDNDNGKTVNLNRIDISAAWVVFNHWRVLGGWNYNISVNNPLAYLYGLEYDTCCWSIRAVADKVRNTDGTHTREYAIQIMLKGIGGYGYNNAGSMIMDQVPGFQDNFTKGYL